MLPDAVVVQRRTPASLEARTVRLAASLADKRVEIYSAEVASLRGFAAMLRAGRWLPVGSVEYVQEAMRLINLDPPEFNCYPRELQSYLCAQPRRSTAARALITSTPVFVKPMRTKLFDGFVFQPHGFDIGAALARWQQRQHPDPRGAAEQEERDYAHKLGELLALAPNTPVWCADPCEFVSEWRYYLLGGRLIGYARYDEGAEDAPAPSNADVSSMLADAPHASTCSLDVGVSIDGATWLIEANDAWALGYYGGATSPSAQAYLCMLWARWQEIAAISRA